MMILSIGRTLNKSLWLLRKKTAGPITGFIPLEKHKLEFPAGFTLLEVILVVIVLSVIAGVTIPNFSSSYARFQLKSTADQLAYLMRYAQSRAINKNNVVRMEFDTTFKSYWLTELTADDDTEEDVFERIPGRLGRTFSIAGREHVEATEALFKFYPDGQIDRIRVYVCREEDCFTISTKEQRGYVNVFNSRLSDA